MAEIKQNLPFRPLEVRGHGVFDPQKGTFYPFKHFHTTDDDLAAKAGIRYFVHIVAVSMTNEGDKGFAHGFWRGIVNGANQYIISVYIGSTTAASGVPETVFATITPDLLTDAGSKIEYVENASYGYGTIVYAEIPDDVSGQ